MRSVLVPSSLGVVASIDLAFSLVILVVLGLSLRAAHHFHTTSGLSPLGMPWSMTKRGENK